jgi:hypothetical protein
MYVLGYKTYHIPDDYYSRIKVPCDMSCIALCDIDFRKGVRIYKARMMVGEQ